MSMIPRECKKVIRLVQLTTTFALFVSQLFVLRHASFSSSSLSSSFNFVNAFTSSVTPFHSRIVGCCRMTHTDSHKKSLIYKHHALFSSSSSTSSSQENENKKDNDDQDNEDEDEEDEYDRWEIGNVEEDLRNLQIAIGINSSQYDLQQSHRIHLLNEFAKQRRDLYQDLKEYAIRPMGVIALISILVNNAFLGKKKNLKWMGMVWRFGLRTMNVGYWMGHVCLPLFVYFSMLLKNKFNNKVKPQSKSLSSKFIPFYQQNEEDSDNQAYLDQLYGDYKRGFGFSGFSGFGCLVSNNNNNDSNGNNCNNCTLCLMENWFSSVFLSAVLGITTTVLTANKKSQLLMDTVSNGKWWKFVWHLSQLLNRIGAVMALHQYPELMYKLQRSNQPRPVSFLLTIVQSMVKFVIWTLPWGFACDWIQSINILRQKPLPINIISSTPTSPSSSFNILRILRRQRPVELPVTTITPSPSSLNNILRILRQQSEKIQQENG